jgi:hypothetical protein
MRTALALAVLAAACFTATAEAQRGGGSGDNPTITLYERPGYEGRSVTLDGDAPDLRWVQMNDMASSIRFDGGQWEVCLEPDFGGTCQVLSTELSDMTQWAFNDRITSVRAIHRPRRDRREGVTLYAGEDYTGRSVTIVRETNDLRRDGFNDDARSIRIHSGSWTLCEDTNFGGRCVELSRDSADLTLYRMEARLSSMGPDGVPRNDPAPAPNPGYPGSGYDSGYGSGYGAGDRLTGGVRGVDAVFFARPELNGYPLAACADRFQRQCGREAADLACRAAGLSRAVWSGEARAPYGQAWAIGDRSAVNARAVLVDLVCVN